MNFKHILFLVSLVGISLVGVTASCETYDWKKDLFSPLAPGQRYPLLGGALTTAVVWGNHHAWTKTPEEDIRRDKPLGDLAKVGDYSGQLVPNALFVGYQAWAYWRGHEEAHATKAWAMFKASAYAGGWILVLKNLVHEKRPDPSEDRHSFPSGHSTTAFAFAAVVDAFEDGWLSYSAYALATLVAFSRVNDGMHYFHDTIAGGTIGLVYGWGIAKPMAAATAGVASRGSVSHERELRGQIVPVGPHDSLGLTYALGF